MPSPLHSDSAPALSQVTVALIGAGPFADAYAPLLQCVLGLASCVYWAMYIGGSFMQPSHDPTLRELQNPQRATWRYQRISWILELIMLVAANGQLFEAGRCSCICLECAL